MEYFFSFDKLEYVRKKSENDNACIFCEIQNNLNNDNNLSILETNQIYVLLNLYPYNPGHSMIIPRRHLCDIRQLSDNENHEMDKVRNYILDVLSAIYQPHGFNVGFNMGLPSGASIAHLHQHIIPRYPNEIGVAELLGGKRVLVENPLKSAEKMRKYMDNHPFSI